jgi:cytidine deaminase
VTVVATPTAEALAQLVSAVGELIEQRFPSIAEGAAGVLLENGDVLTSTSPATFNSSVDLCHEVGAYCEAYKRGQPILASVCFARDLNGGRVFLSPCGVCMERLAIYGKDVVVGVPDPGDASSVRWTTLAEAHPHYWRRVFPDETPGW